MKIIEIETQIIKAREICISVDPETRNLYFYTEVNGIMIPLSDEEKIEMLRLLHQKADHKSKSLIDNVVQKYLYDNEQKGYVNENLFRNYQNIRVYCSSCVETKASASYEAVGNILNINLPNSVVENKNLLNRYLIETILTHEVGHMSVSKIELDSEDNIVATTGFLRKKVPIMAITTTSDGHIYYRPNYAAKVEENNGRGLEELFNILETDSRTNNHLAPDFGYRLDTMTNGALA